jgi:hypothetical protein
MALDVLQLFRPTAFVGAEGLCPTFGGQTGEARFDDPE